MLDPLEKLRAGLRAMPVPQPQPGFIDRVLANATSRQPVRKPEGFRAALRQASTWWAAAAGALVATLACVGLLWIQSSTPAEQILALTLNESRDVPLVIDAERDLDGATMRVYVTGSVALAGYEDQHEVEWKISLTRGANLLSLPVVARATGDGHVVAEIEHDGRIRRLNVALHVSAPRMTSHES
ncbi:MAG: hypothetical protein ABI821_20140 [Pseudomonadota bacterium]